MEPDILKLKLDSVSEKIPKNQWKYFHKRSIRNFILGIELIEGKTERENTAQILIKCLNDIEGNFEPNIDYSIYLFNNYLKYIVPEYQNRLGFWPIPNRNALIFYTILAILVFILLLNYIIIELLFCLMLFLLIYKLLNGFVKHKVFGFRY